MSCHCPDCRAEYNCECPAEVEVERLRTSLEWIAAMIEQSPSHAATETLDILRKVKAALDGEEP